MKISYFILTGSIFLILSCSVKNNNTIPKDNEYSLYVFEDYGKIKLYCNDSLLYEGDFIVTDEPGHMFISNLQKEDVTKFRYVTMDRDTTFCVSTIHVDSLLIGFSYKGVLSIFDNHTRAAWLID